MSPNAIGTYQNSVESIGDVSNSKIIDWNGVVLPFKNFGWNYKHNHTGLMVGFSAPIEREPI
jgi:hypothetical protein